jgi:hypothetical protein
MSDGTHIGPSDEQKANAISPRFLSLDTDANVKSTRLVQSLKQDFAIVSTDEGIQIDGSDEQNANAGSEMIKSFDPDSNVTDQTEQQSLKQ